MINLYATFPFPSTKQHALLIKCECCHVQMPTRTDRVDWNEAVHLPWNSIIHQVIFLDIVCSASNTTSFDCMHGRVWSVLCVCLYVNGLAMSSRGVFLRASTSTYIHILAILAWSGLHFIACGYGFVFNRFQCNNCCGRCLLGITGGRYPICWHEPGRLLTHYLSHSSRHQESIRLQLANCQEIPSCMYIYIYIYIDWLCVVVVVLSGISNHFTNTQIISLLRQQTFDIKWIIRNGETEQTTEQCCVFFTIKIVK